MLLILLSWIYLFAVSLVIGTSSCKALRIPAIHPVICLFIGLFFCTLFIGFWAIFLAIDELFFIFFFLSNCLLFIRYKHDVISKFISFKALFFNLNLLFKVFISILLILILAKCASPPFIIDNETYYIQTIKWLNQYGFVKGLTNLHFFLGQTSGWHILQSGFNFAFIYDNFNDISGFCLLLGNLFTIEKLNTYLTNTVKNKIDLIIGLFPVFNIFLFQFIGAPSPDIAIYVLGMIIFYEFVKCFKEYNSYSFYTVFILSVFAILIKPTGIIFLVLALILYFYYYLFTRKRTPALFIIGFTAFSLFLIKNIIITGHLLYPLTIESLQADWSLPDAISTYFSKYEKAASYGLTIETYKNTSIIKRFITWITQRNLDGLFNASIIVQLIIIPFFIRKTKSIQIVYCLGLVFIIVLLFFSPQYRFYFPFLMLFSLIIVSAFLHNKKIIYTLIGFSLVFPIISMFFSFDTSMITKTKNHQELTAFSINYSIKPHSNSKYKSDFDVITLKNTRIYIPTAIDFIWATGNTPLPALNKKQLDYLSTYFYVYPQQFSNNLKNGFYSESIIND